MFVSLSQANTWGTKTGSGTGGRAAGAAGGLPGRLCCCSPAQAAISWNSKKAALCVELANWLPNTGTSLLVSRYSGFSSTQSPLSDLLVLLHRQDLQFLTHIQRIDCLSSRAAQAGHAHLPLLCRTQHRGCTNLAISQIAFFFPSLPSLALLLSFTDQALSKHWVLSTSLWLLHLQHIPACGIKP